MAPDLAEGVLAGQARALELAAVSAAVHREWSPPVVKTVAITGSGVSELVEAFLKEAGSHG